MVTGETEAEAARKQQKNGAENGSVHMAVVIRDERHWETPVQFTERNMTQTQQTQAEAVPVLFSGKRRIYWELLGLLFNTSWLVKDARYMINRIDSNMTQQHLILLSCLLCCLFTTRESQYCTKPFEQTLSVDLCGTAGKCFSCLLRC